eukprot:145577_1
MQTFIQSDSLTQNQCDALYDDLQYINQTEPLYNQDVNLQLSLSAVSPSNDPNSNRTMSIVSPKDIDQDEQNNKDKLTYWFYDNETLLHLWFVKYPKTAEKIIQIVNHWGFAFTIISVSGIFAFVWNYSDVVSIEETDGEEGNPLFFAIGIFILLIGILWMFALLFSMNRKAFKMIVVTPEFWIKIVYALMGAVLSLYIVYQIDGEVKPLRFAARLLFRVLFVLMVIAMSSLDALSLHGNSRIKKFFCLLGCIAMVVYSITATVEFVTKSEEKIEKEGSWTIYNAIEISAYSIRNSSYRIVMIFFVKQTYFTFYKNTKEDRCVLIKYMPYLEWRPYRETHGNRLHSTYTSPTHTAYHNQSDSDEYDNKPHPKEIQMGVHIETAKHHRHSITASIDAPHELDQQDSTAL